MRVDEAIPQYLTYLHSVARRAPATITAYRHDLARFVSFLEADAHLTLTDNNAPSHRGLDRLHAPPLHLHGSPRP